MHSSSSFPRHRALACNMRSETLGPCSPHSAAGGSVASSTAGRRSSDRAKASSRTQGAGFGVFRSGKATGKPSGLVFPSDRDGQACPPALGA